MLELHMILVAITIHLDFYIFIVLGRRCTHKRSTNKLIKNLTVKALNILVISDVQYKYNGLIDLFYIATHYFKTRTSNNYILIT